MAFFQFPKRAVALSGIAWASISTAGEFRLDVREPVPQTYRIVTSDRAGQPAGAGVEWLHARREGTADEVLLGRRVVVQLKEGTAPDSVLPSGVPRTHFAATLWILDLPDVGAAIAVTAELAQRSEVTVVHPIRRRLNFRQRAYAPRPKDTLFDRQWHLDNRDPATGVARGIDLNVRAAWALTRGTNVTVGLADSGIQVTHPDLGQTEGAPHYDFFGDRLGEPMSDTDGVHGTSCAGIIAATGNNNLGVVGLAPEARLASWPIFGLHDFGDGYGPVDVFADDASLAKLFRYKNDSVAVQNHSWGSSGVSLSSMDALSDVAVGEAVTNGRSGLGVVIVRAGGNNREELTNSDDDGYAADPRTIAVAAVRADGRATSYSSPGANLLVGAPSGDPISDTEEDPAAPNIVTTDLVGSDGYNTADGEAGDYDIGATGFDGTSASSPEIAGVCALILSANPRLSYRDVQQVLVLAGRHFDFADSDVRTNGAGFVVSHNVGFGVPDAGLAVQMARHWSNRPALTQTSQADNTRRSIADNSLRLELSGPSLPSSLTSVRCLPSQGPHAETGTASLPLVYVGLGNTNIDSDLHGKAALIQRGDNFFYDKIERASKAGAEFAVIYNNVTTMPQLLVMFGTGFTPIPAIFVSKADGDALRKYVLAESTNTARLTLKPTSVSWTVEKTLRCEHVGVRIKTTHPSRADLRITLVSPSGTRSILQFISNDTDAGPKDWTYWTTHHFFESSYGEWHLDVTDERLGSTGSITSAELILRGTGILDTDHDGLDDDWERAMFGDLRYGPQDDPDGDGLSNAREQCLDTNPARYDPIMPVAFEAVEGGLIRVTTPADFGRYAVDTATQVEGPYSPVGTLTNSSPYLQIFTPAQAAGGNGQQFFRTRRLP